MISEIPIIPAPIRFLAVLASVAYLYGIIAALRGSRMAVRQSILWLASGFAFLLVSLFPAPILRLAEWVGFVAPSNAGFVVWMLALTGLVFYQSLTTSRHAAQIKTLAQELALRDAEARHAAERAASQDKPDR